MTRLHLTTATIHADEASRASALSLTMHFREGINQSHGTFTETHSPADADIILFVEPPCEKKPEHLAVLQNHRLIQAYPDKCYTYDGEDIPRGFLPGAYPSMGRKRLSVNHGRCFACPYVIDVSELDCHSKEIGLHEPDLLFQFMGFASSRVRTELFSWQAPAVPHEITRTYGWFDHTHSQRQSFVRGILRSKFAICPRGIGVSTYRLYQAMALGRACIILSDDWEAFPGPQWEQFSIRVPERDFKRIPSIVADASDRWREMGERARDAFDDWVRPPAAAKYILTGIRDLWVLRQQYRAWVEEIPAYWDSHAFRWQQGWTRPQVAVRRIAGVARSIAAGTLLKKLRMRG